MEITPNRLVAVLTPLVFAPLAGAVSVFVAEHLPGIDVDRDQLQQVFIAGALIAFGKAGLWLKGWQDWEKRQDAVPAEVINDVGLEATIDSGSENVDDDALASDDPALDDLDPDADPDLDPEDEGDEGQPFEDDLAVAGRD